MSEDPRPLTAGVCGYPISHSKSPRLFRHWFETYGIAGSYIPLRIEPGNFETAILGLIAAGFRGCNVTLPHKETALAMADEVTEAGQTIGAVNTLVFRHDGSIHADNSDAFGFTENLRAGAPGWKPEAGPAVMIGAGGAARAGLHALLEAGAPEIRLTNRTREKAEALAEHFGPRVTVVDWSERGEAVDGAMTIANSTSLGMTAQPPLDFPLDAAPAGAVVTDMVYAPLETDLLANVRARGLSVVDGLGMLLHQARPGFRRWFGREAEVTEELRAACLESST